MEATDLIKLATQVLEQLGVAYLVTGSVASGYHGEPRLTQDVDIVARLPLEKITAFCAAFPEPDFYISSQAARDAVPRHSQFNIIHPASGLKIAVMIPADTPFDTSRFARAWRVHPREDFEANFASPEDVILKKMEYYRDGASEKHLRDITGILKVSGDQVDRAYVREWARKLGVMEIWHAVLRRVERPKK